eukprot:9832516-Prorocentrum_lima.AAC.1
MRDGSRSHPVKSGTLLARPHNLRVNGRRRRGCASILQQSVRPLPMLCGSRLVPPIQRRRQARGQAVEGGG